MATYLLHHTHTPYSNRTEQDVRGDDGGWNHYADYVRLVETLPAGTNVVLTRTDHWRAEADFYDELSGRVSNAGGRLVRHDRHVTFELGGSRAAVVHGVETSLADGGHVTVCGLPLDDGRTYRRLDVETLVETGGRAGWIAPAHPFLPGASVGECLLRRLVTESLDHGVPVALARSVGYLRTLNAVAAGRLRRGPSVRSLADEYGVPLVPEYDWHVALPDLTGRLPDGVMADLVGGRLPVDRLLAASVDPTVGLSPIQFSRSFPDLVPGFETALGRRLLPQSPDEFRAVVERSLGRVRIDGPRAVRAVD